MADPGQAMLAASLLGGFGDHNAARRHQKSRELETFGNRLFQPKFSPCFDPAKTIRIDKLAEDASRVLSTGKCLVELLEERSRRPLAGSDLGELFAVCRIGGLNEVQDSLRTPTAEESDWIHWHLSRIQNEFSDACHRGATKLRDWLTREGEHWVDAEWQQVYHTISSAWVTSGAGGWHCARSDSTELLPRSYSSTGEQWGEAFVGTDEPKVYNYEVCLDKQWTVKSVQQHQALLRAIITSASVGSLNLILPDVLELGTGKTCLPPLAFYEAVLELGHCAANRIRADFEKKWGSVVLKGLVAVDPVAAAYGGLYGIVPRASPAFPQRHSPLRHWRDLVGFLVVPPREGESPSIDGVQGLEARWLEVFYGCEQQEHRLILARDACQLGLMEDKDIEKAVINLLAELDEDWCTDGALLAACIARKVRDDGATIWLKRSVDCLERSLDEEWITHALCHIGPLVSEGGNVLERQRIGQLTNRLSPRHQAVSAGCPSRWVRDWLKLRWPDDFETQVALTATLIVASAMEEWSQTLGNGQESLGEGGLWSELANAVAGEDDAGGRSLVDRLIDLSLTRPLTLSSTAIETLQLAKTCPEAADRAGLARLLPLLQRPAPKALAPIQIWRNETLAQADMCDRGFGNLLKCHAHLWLAENDLRYDKDDLAPLDHLVQNGDDGSRNRARLLLSGSETWLGNRQARFSLSQAGAKGREVMQALGQRVVEERSLERHTWLASASLSEWCIDDPLILSGWLEQLSQHPRNPGLLRTVFRPWRWSPECLVLFRDWGKGVRDSRLLEACIEWLAITRVAAYSSSDNLDTNLVPEIPGWSADLIPATFWLPRQTADATIAAAVTFAAKTSSGRGKLSQQVEEFLAKEVKTLPDHHFAENFELLEAYTSLGDALTQTTGDTPESAWENVNLTTWNGRMVAALVEWTHDSLAKWNNNREECSPVLHNQCVSQLSLLCCAADTWSSVIRQAAARPPADVEFGDRPPWPGLLCQVIRYFPNDRIVQAAWSLLRLFATPTMSGSELWEAIRCTMRDKPNVRDRALAVIRSSGGSRLATIIPDSSIEESLQAWADEPSSQTSLAMAHLFQILARTPALAPERRQLIQLQLRRLAADQNTYRPLFHMSGTGDSKSPFTIISENRLLNEALEEIDRDLLANISAVNL